MRLNFIWVAVDDTEEAADFYNNLFEVEEPAHIDSRLAIYEFEAVRFAAYGTEFDEWEPTYGENSAPAFEVEDLESERERVLKLVDSVRDYDAGDHKGLLLTDPWGNTLELYSWKELK